VWVRCSVVLFRKTQKAECPFATAVQQQQGAVRVGVCGAAAGRIQVQTEARTADSGALVGALVGAWARLWALQQQLETV
jgi:hypothetical protein